jgi:hypothetical protein
MFPRPDRSNQTPNFKKTDENPQLDIGWQEGVLNDSRPYRVEVWCEDQTSFVTYFFSVIGLEHETSDALVNMLEREGLLRFRLGAPRYTSATQIKDGRGQELWSVTVVVGTEDETFVDETAALQRYASRPAV